MKKKLILPMNAYVGNKEDLEKSDLIFEPKLDGFRALCYVNKNLKLISRNSINITDDYPEFNFRKNIKAKNCILDGEIVAYDKNGKPSFSLLQQGHTATYVVFDILMKDGRFLIDKPLIERKKILDQIIKNGSNLEKIIFTKNGQDLWREVIKYGLEGVMAKEVESKYYPGLRSRIWLKIKQLNTIDCIIIGYTTQKRKIASLLLGLYDSKNNLKFIGKVGTGFSFATLKLLQDKFDKIKSTRSFLSEEVKGKNITWLKPRLVCEIEYLEVTKNYYLRAPAFKRLRADKKAKSCTFKDQMNLNL